MGYKDDDSIRELFKGRIIDTNAIDAAAAIQGTQLDSATIAELEIAPGVITNTEIAANAGIVGTKLAAGANIAPTQLAAGVTKVLSGTVIFSDTLKNVITIPANALVTDVIAVCTATWNGTVPKVDIGDDDDPDGFIAYGNVGLTSGNISGQDPTLRGAYLYTVGTQSTTAGDWTVTQGTLTPAALTGSNSTWAYDGTGHMTTGANSTLSLSTGGSLSAGSQTKTASNFAVTAWPKHLKKLYTVGTKHVTATVGTTGSPTTGALTIYCVYVALA